MLLLVVVVVLSLLLVLLLLVVVVVVVVLLSLLLRRHRNCARQHASNGRMLPTLREGGTDGGYRGPLSYAGARVAQKGLPRLAYMPAGVHVG